MAPSSSTPLLLGPPEIYQQPPAPAPTPPPAFPIRPATAGFIVPGRRYLDALNENLDKIAAMQKNQKPPKVIRKKPPPPAIRKKPRKDRPTAFRRKTKMGLTENYSPTFLSSGNPCLDFFFHVVPDTLPNDLKQRLQLAWNHDKLKALKLVCHLRGVRGTGKSDREGFYTAALWLHKNHPKTLASNVASFAEFGYFKDLPEILFRLLKGANARKLEKDRWQSRKRGIDLRNYMVQRGRDQRGFRGRRVMAPTINLNDDNLSKWRKSLKREGGSKSTNEEKRIKNAKKVVKRFNHDPKFKFLHDCVSDVFALYLRSDMKLLNSGDSNKISLAAKWCPSLDSSFDRITLLCETIAKRVFPREEYPEYEGVEEPHYAYRVRDRLRKEVLMPLRKVLELPEVYIGANDWGSIPYNRVASVAMTLYKDKFLKHDKERFREYLGRVRSGEAKIAAGALLPHDIIAALEDPDGGRVAELQWKRMVSDLSKKGKLNNCLAISDVSGSMSGIPMEVSVALGVLVSELSEEPWKGKIITFSADPKLQMVEGDSLREKTEFVERMEWGMNTDFQKVFNLILAVAVNGKLKPDEMIKRLFVFSDMEFDCASQNPWETDYQAIVRKFRRNGYGRCVPEIVFWNLRDSRATPVPAKQAGVALVSGYSKNLMKLFMEEGGSFSPEAVMDAAISGAEYQKLLLVD